MISVKQCFPDKALLYAQRLLYAQDLHRSKLDKIWAWGREVNIKSLLPTRILFSIYNCSERVKQSSHSKTGQHEMDSMWFFLFFLLFMCVLFMV